MTSRLSSILVGATVSVILPCVILCGCITKTSQQPSLTNSVRSSAQPTVAAQAILHDLGLKCSSTEWRREFDWIERPETRPPNLEVNGEAAAYLSDVKKRLAECGVKVRWNHEKKAYEVVSDKNAL